MPAGDSLSLASFLLLPSQAIHTFSSLRSTHPPSTPRYPVLEPPLPLSAGDRKKFLSRNVLNFLSLLSLAPLPLGPHWEKFLHLILTSPPDQADWGSPASFPSRFFPGTLPPQLLPPALPAFPQVLGGCHRCTAPTSLFSSSPARHPLPPQSIQHRQCLRRACRPGAGFGAGFPQVSNDPPAAGNRQVLLGS